MHVHFRLNAFGLEVEAEEDDISSESDSGSSPPSSDISTSSFDSRFVVSHSIICSIRICSASFEIGDVDRRQEMLDLSITKIQTINASHIPVSLRKSVLIYNTMKTLQVCVIQSMLRVKFWFQRDLSQFDSGSAYSSLDHDDFEMDDDSSYDMNGGSVRCLPNQGYPWPSERVYPEPQGGEWSWSDDPQPMETNMIATKEVHKTYELLGGDVSGQHDEGGYNPLTHNNLAQMDLLHMFGASSAVSSQG